jgi:hypothetical protein
MLVPRDTDRLETDSENLLIIPFSLALRDCKCLTLLPLRAHARTFFVRSPFSPGAGMSRRRSVQGIRSITATNRLLHAT